MMIQELVNLRNKMKANKPAFIRHDAHKKKRVSTNWRRPKGHQNKMRLHMKGYRRGRSTGFGSPVLAKGLSRTGLVQNLINTMKDFEGLDKVKDGIIIGRTVGNRKKALLVEFAQKQGFAILNITADKFNKSYAKEQDDKKAKHAVLDKRKQAKEQLEAKSKKNSKKGNKAESKKEAATEAKTGEKK